ncbi:MAG: hypothetical protein HQK91_03550 [Nitrospirae bacterium]|nr:hypothetical protein [Nitrospirota bacterium]MBF0540511.1 hypothetical protein [Nitrospirota bacterium]
MSIKKNIIISIIVIIDIAAILFGLTLFAENIIKNKLDVAILRLKGTVDVTYDNVNFNLFKLSSSIKNVKITPTGKKDGVNIDSITISSIDRKNDIPTYLNFTASGINLKITEQMFTLKTQPLTALGFKNLNGNLELNYKYDTEKKELNLIKLSAKIDKIGDVDIISHLGNINLTFFDNPVTTNMAIPNILLYNAEINYKDSAFINRLFKLFAEENKTSPELQEVLFNAMIDQQFAAATDDYAKKSIPEFKKFVSSPDKITFKINPKKPMSFGLLKEIEYSKMPELLCLEITSTEKSTPKPTETPKIAETPKTVEPPKSSGAIKTKESNLKK